MDKKIINLIDNNNWSKINKLISSTPSVLTIKLGTDENTIAHMAALHNYGKLNSLTNANTNNANANTNANANANTNIMEIGNKYGDTPLHLMAKYGYFSLFKKTVKSKPHLINLVNNDFKTPLHFIYDHDMLKWIVENIKEVDLNIIDERGHTVLIQNIIKTRNAKDEYYKNIVFLLKNKKNNLGIPEYHPPLSIALSMGKKNITKLLLNKNVDIHFKNKQHLTPFLLSVYHKMHDVALDLIKKGADINYVGAEGDQNPLIYALLNNDIKMANILINNGFNVNKYDRYMDTSAHVGLGMIKNLSTNMIAQFIYYGDMNSKNLNGITPLHLLLKYRDWKNFNVLLEKKKLDIFIKDKNGIAPINYIKPADLSNFIDIITKSYIGQLQNHKCSNKHEKRECIQMVKQFILDNQKSYPNSKDEQYMYDKFKLVQNMYKTNNKEIRGHFNSDTLHNFIYTINILKELDNVFIPFQYQIHDKIINDRMLLNSMDFFKDSYGKVISELIKIYTEYFYGILPYLILWRSSTHNYIHPNLDFYVQAGMNSKKIRFILFKLTLVTSPQSSHANILIFDKKTKILERFEPYGNIPYLDNDKLDEFLETHIGPICGYKEYLSPKKYMKNISFQIISNDTNSQVRKLGDPIGYCLAWCFWYLELRSKNPDIRSDKLIELALNKIKRSGKTTFIDYIRDYSKKLDRHKNTFILLSGVQKEKVYNMVFKRTDQNKILSNLMSTFSELIKKRL